MAIAVEMPKMSDTMEEGVLVAWLVEEGDTVSAGDAIAQVETDKATMDLEVYDDGTVLRRVVEAGSSIPIGSLVAVLGEEGEDPSDVINEYAGSNGQAAAPTEKEAAPAKEEPADSDEPREQPAEAPVADVPPEDDDIKASPLARRMAREQEVNLADIPGTGPDGRIIKRDVEAFLEDQGISVSRPEKRREEPTEEPAVPRRPAPKAEEVAGETVPISQMRKTIARRLSESKYTSPHFYLTIDLDASGLMAMRARLNEGAEEAGRPRISVNDFITKACAAALRLHPWVNSSYNEEAGEVVLHEDINVAVAVAVDEGLLTPVIRHADRKGLTEIADQTRELASLARDRKLQPADWEGSTFTTSNLGMFGIEEFTAIINPPNACILAIGTIRETPVVENGELTVGSRMKVTLSCDHRLVDGATGARFMEDLRGFIEDPARMLL